MNLQIPALEVFGKKKLHFLGVGCKNAPANNGPERHNSRRK